MTDLPIKTHAWNGKSFGHKPPADLNHVTNPKTAKASAGLLNLKNITGLELALEYIEMRQNTGTYRVWH